MKRKSAGSCSNFAFAQLSTELFVMIFCFFFILAGTVYLCGVHRAPLPLKLNAVTLLSQPHWMQANVESVCAQSRVKKKKPKQIKNPVNSIFLTILFD